MRNASTAPAADECIRCREGDKSAGRRKHHQNRKYVTCYIVVRGGPSHGHIRNMYRTFVMFGRIVFEIQCSLCEPTDRQTDAIIAILRTHPVGEVIIFVSPSL